MTQEVPVQLRGFKGINVREDSAIIQDNELMDCLNFDLGRSGELMKRSGFEQVHSGSTLGNQSPLLLGHFLTDVYSQLLARSGNGLYFSNDGATWTLIHATKGDEVTHGVQYAGKFYILRNNNVMMSWDGVTLTDITGSPTGTVGVIYKDRLFVMNSRATGGLNSRVYYSKPGDLSSTGWVSTNFIDVSPGDGDFGVTFGIIQDLLVIFKGKSTWALYTNGAPVDWVLRNLNSQIGCISKKSVREIEGFLYFASATAVYRSDGTSFEDISEPISKVLRGRVVNLTNLNNDSFAFWEDKLICLLAPTPSTRRYMVFHTKAGGWTEWKIGGAMPFRPKDFLEVRTTVPQVGLYCVDENPTGKVFRFGNPTSFNDAGARYVCRFATKQYDFDEPTMTKRGKWLSIDSVGKGKIDFDHWVNSEPLVSGILEIVTVRAGIKFPGPGYFRTWQLELSIDTEGDFQLFTITLHMAMKRPIIKVAT